MQVLMILWSCRTVAAGNLSLLELNGLTISIGISSGIMGSFFQSILLVWIAVVLGITGLIFFILQAFLAVSLLEIVNYIEHYGLMRKPLDKNHYEAVKPWHSWNSSNWLTNRFLFNLPRHSDHHYKPGRQYQSLPHFERARNCPQAMPEWYCWQPYPPYGDG